MPWTRRVSWKLAGGVWGPVETDPAAQLFFGASRPTSPVAEVTAIASVLRMLRAARVSIPLTILSDSKYALGVVLGEDRALSEIPLVQLARSEARCYRQRAVIDCRHVAAHRELAGNEAADRLADAGRRRWMVPERAAAFISCASSIPPQLEAPFFTLADRIFWQKSRTRSIRCGLFGLADSLSRLWSSSSGPPMSVRCFPPSAALLLGLVLLL